MPADPTAAIARVREEMARTFSSHPLPDHYHINGDDLRTLLALAEAAVEETRAEDEEEAAYLRWEEFGGYIAYEQHDDAKRGTEEAREHRRALARGEG